MAEKKTRTLPLSEMAPGSRVKVVSLLAEGLVRRRLLDLGMVPQTMVEVVRRSPIGDPTAYRVRGTTIGLRKEDAKKIIVEPLSK
ncbi:ferrous iron transport protein A [Aneurinibacillus sp. BA2021]|nr:ferrous iron transport protein A [Aneurinibacillus sp. BA2021]